MFNPCLCLDPVLNAPEQVLEANRENIHDRNAVTLVLEEIGIVGHVPKNISKLCHSFHFRGGTIEAVVIGERQYAADLPQGGLRWSTRAM